MFYNLYITCLVGETEVGESDPHLEECLIVLLTFEPRFDWLRYGDKWVDLGRGRFSKLFCNVLNFTVSALPVGGNVQWTLLTHPGGALCFTSDNGTNVVKIIFSSKFSVVETAGVISENFNIKNVSIYSQRIAAGANTASQVKYFNETAEKSNLVYSTSTYPGFSKKNVKM